LGDAGIAGNVEFVVGGIEATTSGTPYTLTVAGADTNGDPCTGTSNPFGVAAGADNYVGINIVCTIPTDAAVATDANTGSVQIDAGITYVTQGAINCPGIQSVSVYPALGLSQAGAAASEDLLTVTGVSANQASGGTLGTFAWTTNAPAGSLPATSTSGTAIQFNCNVAGPGTWTINTQLQDNTIPVGQDASANVCAGQTDTTLTGITVNCAGSGCFLPVGDINCSATADAGGCTPTPNSTTSNCGTCGNVCSGATPICTISGSAPGGFKCAASPPVPCTVAGQTNCVQCPGSTGGVCDATEALFVNIDITNGVVTTNTPDSAPTGCYECLLGGSCIDSPAAHQAGLECEDLTGNFTDFGGATGVASTLCDNALACIVGTQGAGCAANAEGEAFCYCGTGPGATIASCNGDGAAVNGNCLSTLVLGYPFASTNTPSVLPGLTGSAYPSGKAMALISCAQTNSCTQCLQP
jgi:hypothetical protein